MPIIFSKNSKIYIIVLNNTLRVATPLFWFLQKNPHFFPIFAQTIIYMPFISDKAQQMPASPIRKLVPFAEQAHKDGKTVYYLNIGQPDIKTPNIVLDQIHIMDLPVIEYSHSAGFESYRKGLAEYYAKNDILVDYTDILVTTGGSEALMFGFQTCFNPGDEVIIPEPFYANYNGFAASAGIKVVPVTASIDNG